MTYNPDQIFNEGIVNFSRNNYSNAIKQFKLAFKQYLIKNNFVNAGKSLNKIGEAYMLSQQFRPALNYLLKGYIFRKDNEDIFGILESLNSLGEIYYYLDNYEKSMEYYEKCISNSKKNNNEYFLATALKNRGWLKFKSNNGQNSILKDLNKYFPKIKIKKTGKKFISPRVLPINQEKTDKRVSSIKEISNNYFKIISAKVDHSVDIDTGYIYEEKKAEEHYFRLNKLLFKLSELYKKQVVVTVHPDDSLELKKKLFPKFKVVQHETLDHIRKSYMVLFFDSTAITDAIFLEKRIVAICSPFTHSVPRDGSKEYSARAGIFLMDLDKELSIDKEKLLSNLENHKKGYSDYIKKYIAPDGDGLGYQKIIETIKNKFF